MQFGVEFQGKKWNYSEHLGWEQGGEGVYLDDPSLSFVLLCVGCPEQMCTWDMFGQRYNLRKVPAILLHLPGSRESFLLSKLSCEFTIVREKWPHKEHCRQARSQMEVKSKPKMICTIRNWGKTINISDDVEWPFQNTCLSNKRWEHWMSYCSLWHSKQWRQQGQRSMLAKASSDDNLPNTFTHSLEQRKGQ